MDFQYNDSEELILTRDDYNNVYQLLKNKSYNKQINYNNIDVPLLMKNNRKLIKDFFRLCKDQNILKHFY
jgi:hypothetical protein